MTDAAPDQAAPPAEAPAAVAPGIRILAQFIRDLSFENPRAPDSLHTSNAPPSIDLGVEVNARGRIDGLFEVDLKLMATAQREGEAVFHLELVYGALVSVVGVPEADIEAVLLIECPRFLFPYARRLVADLSIEGGFPPFVLDPLDFGAIYAQRKAAEAQQTLGNA
jgi:preprotein translocase subunit SecB